jgi:hypothetical protein
MDVAAVYALAQVRQWKRPQPGEADYSLQTNIFSVHFLSDSYTTRNETTAVSLQQIVSTDFQLIII